MANGCKLEYQGKESRQNIVELTKPAKIIKKKRIENQNSLSKFVQFKFENRLIHGDNLHVLKSLFNEDEIKGKVKLIYIDPPYSTKKKFSTRDEEEAYFDLLVGSEYVDFIRKRLIFLHELLAEDGSIYVHLDQKMGHYIKIILDEIFGQENFRNDITRIKCNPKNFKRKAYGNIKDVIYFYSKKNVKGNTITWNDYQPPFSENEIIGRFQKMDKYGRRYATTPLHAKGVTLNGPTGQEWKGLMPPKGRHWRYSPEELTKLDEKGLIEWSSSGNPRKIIYADESLGRKMQDVWDFRDKGDERAVYPTEKNEDLLKLIISNSSNKGDLVLDCFAGSGTTLAVAEQLGRKWIGIDESDLAIETTQKRIMSMKNYSPFILFETANKFVKD